MAEQDKPKNSAQLKRGMQIIYVPTHVEGDLNHPDCQPGFVTSVTDHGAFCRYWIKWHGQLLYPLDLRTKANSELTPFEVIVIQDTVDQSAVEQALKEYC